MKVSSKFILGFIVLTLLAVVILAYQRSTITEMQRVNVELSGINLKSARTALEIQRWSDLLEEDSKKYFLLSLDSQYENDIMRGRMDLLDDVNILQQTSKTVREQEQTEKIAQALDDYWEVFDPLYARHQ